jgi:type II secretory pathway component GspD/PulD (secretin)
MRTNVSISLVVLMLCLLLYQSSAAQELEAPEKTKIARLKVRNADIIEVLGELSVTYKIPIGFERMLESSVNRHEENITVALRNVSAAEVLDEIARQTGRFTWASVNGVIHVYPRSDPGRLSRRYLDCKIAKFDLLEATDYSSLRSLLTNLPEVSAISTKYGVSANNIELFAAGIEKAYPFSVTLRNAALSDLLDQIVLQGPKKMWIVTVMEKESEEHAELVVNFL